MYNTDISIQLSPEGITKPIITYGVDNQNINTITIDETMSITFSLDFVEGTHSVFLDFANKTNNTADMALIIDSVTIEGMTLDRFKWAGLYYPDYPEPWASEQTELLPKVRTNSTYLGWNGRWELPFTAPIFTWIHNLENLGWLYTVD
jgi:hypothetical protein